MIYLNRKGYTLSQFILVWILGAIFVIFVFLTVSRYRATAQAKEAESFMQAVRAEQEDRCVVGRKYAVYSNHLKTFYKRKQDTKYVMYDLSSGSGITARNKLYGYRLQMPSYADGRICCDNCEKLDRYYSPCKVLTSRTDFIPADPDCTVYVKDKKKKKGIAVTQPTDRPLLPPAKPEEPVAQPTEKTMTGAVVSPAEETMPQATLEPPAVPAAQTTDVALSEKAEEAEPQPVPQTDRPDCPVPETGDFYIDSCETYQAGTQGAVMHTWNGETCSYEVVQNCMVPAHWQLLKSSKSEHGLYPSDLDNYCTDLMQGQPCETSVRSGQECFSADETCYKSCRFSQRTQVEEAANIILYDVEVQIEQLRCVPAKTVKVSVS